MESGRQIQYVLTLWPQEIPPPVLFRPAGGRLTPGGFLEFDRHEWREGPLSPDLYLYGFWDLDLGDDEAIAEFVTTHGPFAPTGWADLPLDTCMDVPDDVEAVLRQRLEPERDLSNRLFSHVNEFRVYAQVLRDAIRLGWAYKGEMSYHDVIDQWESRVYPPGWTRGDPERHLEGDCLHRLDDMLAAGLSAFHVRVDVHVVKAVKDDKVDSFRASLGPFPSVYAALCLQLATDLTGNAPYRRCKNTQDCGRLFVRKQGRARGRDRDKFSHRTRGVLEFCSDTCANRYAQRKHRAKLREAAARDNPGPSRKSGQS